MLVKSERDLRELPPYFLAEASTGAPTAIQQLEDLGILARRFRFSPSRPSVISPPHQQVMTAGGGDLEGPLGAFLAFDVPEIGQAAATGATAGSAAAAPACP